MNIVIKVLKQTGWQGGGKIVSLGSSILILALMTRNFGESGTGALTLALTYLAFFSIVVDFGINAHLLKDFLKSDFLVTWQKILGLRIVLGLGLVVLGLLGVFVWPVDLLVKRLVFVGIFWATMEAAVFVSTNIIFQARLRYDLSSLAWIGGSLATLFGVWVVVRMGLGLEYVMGAYGFGFLVTTILGLILVARFVKKITPLFEGKFILKTVRESWPISVTLVLNVVYFRVDTFILAFYKPLAEVGIYNLAYQVFQSSLVLPTYIMNSFYPILLEEFLYKEKFKHLIIRGGLILFFLAIIGFLITQILSPWVIWLLTGGKGFNGSIEALKILSFGYPAFFISALLMWVMVVLKKYKQMLWIYGIGLFINILLNLLLIPDLSFKAAALNTGVSEYLILIFQLIILFKAIKK